MNGSASSIRVRAIQLGSPSASMDEGLRDLGDALCVGTRCDLAVVPELWLTGYFNFDRYESDALTLEEAMERFGALARAHETTIAFGSIVEREATGVLRNTSLLFDARGELQLCYRKTHLFPYLSREPEILEPGDAFPVAEVGGVGVGVCLCYDLRFPEVARSLVANGADVLLVPSAWPGARRDHWRLLLQARAVESQIFVVGCNAPAADADTPDLSLPAGESMIVDPMGRILDTAGAGVGDEAGGDLDPAEIEAFRARFETTGRPRLQSATAALSETVA